MCRPTGRNVKARREASRSIENDKSRRDARLLLLEGTNAGCYAEGDASPGKMNGAEWKCAVMKKKSRIPLTLAVTGTLVVIASLAAMPLEQDWPLVLRLLGNAAGIALAAWGMSGLAIARLRTGAYPANQTADDPETLAQRLRVGRMALCASMPVIGVLEVVCFALNHALPAVLCLGLLLLQPIVLVLLTNYVSRKTQGQG